MDDVEMLDAIRVVRRLRASGIRCGSADGLAPHALVEGRLLLSIEGRRMTVPEAATFLRALSHKQAGAAS